MSRRKLEDPITRFEHNVIADPNSGCWIWAGNLTHNGYGSMASPIKSETRAHRISWAIHVGPVPAGLQVLHKCDVRCCVNPDHLFLGTNYENRLDMVRKNRGRRGEKVPGAKLKEHDVLAIRDRRAKGETLASIAADYGVRQSNICHIVKKQSWKYL